MVYNAPIKGTLLNAAAVLAGGLIGLAAGSHLPPEYKTLAQALIGIGVLAMGLKLFMASENVLIPVGALILGGLLGHLIGLQAGMDALGKWGQETVGGGSSTFQEAFVTPSILFCVGPMTLLGCLEDGLEGKIHLLGIKSILDGISSIFFAAALGPGVLLAAGTVLIVQVPLTLGARKLRFLVKKPHMLNEITASGGMILVAIGLGLLDIKKLPTADFLPALVLAGVVAAIFPSSKDVTSQPS